MVFISYSHDSPEHEAKVLALANRLGEDGIDAVLDQFESFPPEGWELWGQRQIQSARFVLVVCTQTYQRRFDGEEEPGKGLGATSEAGIIRQILYDAGAVNEKFLPVLLTDADSEHVPLKLQGYHHFSLYTAQGYEELRLHLTVKPFLSASGTGHVLMTTRSQATGAIAQGVELEKMELEEGALFLLRRAKLIAPDAPLDAAPEADRKPARELTEAVAGLPLALDQAAAYIEETPSTPAKYLKLYRTEGAALRRRRGSLATEHDSVTVTFSLAFAQVERANPAAADLVRACAFLAPDAILEEIFTQCGKELRGPLAGDSAPRPTPRSRLQ
jgi:hypothetical protein